jgi:excisionase family DNA binding protein
MPTALPEAVNTELPEYLRKREIARILHVSPRTIDKWVMDRRIPFIRVTARLNLYRLRDVQKALEKRVVHELPK